MTQYAALETREELRIIPGVAREDLWDTSVSHVDVIGVCI